MATSACVKMPGKHIMTQLDKGDKELVALEVVKPPSAPMQVPQYEEMLAINEAYQTLGKAGAGANSPAAKVLANTGKIFLAPRYQPQLSSGQMEQLQGPLDAGLVDVPAFKAELMALSEEYQKKGMLLHMECIDTLVTSLTKNQLLTVAQLMRIFEVLGQEAVVPKAQFEQMIDRMLKEGQIDQATAATCRKFASTPTVNINEVLKQMGKNLKYKKPPAGPMVDGKFRKDLPIMKHAPTERHFKGQACGPARLLSHHYFTDARDESMSADLKEDEPVFNVRPKKAT